MSAPWTPGKWEICGDAIRSPIVMEDGWRHVDGGIEIATVKTWLPEWQGNLELLRAAPEIVEALTRCELEMQWAAAHLDVLPDEFAEAMHAARSVLASLHPESKE